ncbi:hypothetical protein D3C84_668780 [compost metagenome]
MPLSLASQLLQFIGVATNNVVTWVPVGAGLPAKAISNSAQDSKAKYRVGIQKDLLMLATTVALHTSSKPQLLVHWLLDKSVSI